MDPRGARPELRVTDADREYAAELVMRGHRDGRLTLNEVDSRLAQIYAAQNAGDLAPLIIDLPSAEDELLPWPPMLEWHGPIVRTGVWTAPRVIRLGQDPVPGDLVRLDFTAAVLPHLVIDIELRLGMYGRAELIVPSTASVDVSGVTGRGMHPRQRVPAEQQPGRLHGRVPRRNAVRILLPNQRILFRF